MSTLVVRKRSRRLRKYQCGCERDRNHCCFTACSASAHKGSLLLEVVEDTVLKDEPALSPALNFPSFLGQPALPLRVEEGLC